MYDNEQEQGVAEQVEDKKPEEVVAEVEAPAVIELEEIGFAGAESPTAKEGEQETPAIRQIREAHTFANSSLSPVALLLTRDLMED